jgi:hypothetical protein
MNAPDWMVVAAVQRVLVIGDDGTAAHWLRQHWGSFPDHLQVRIRYHVREALQQDKWYPILTNESREAWVQLLACVTS